jgi:CBS domain-containing protein
MAQSIREVMTEGVETCAPESSLQEAAEKMQKGDFGAVVVADHGELRGLLTDRDIVVRAVAKGQDPSEVKVEEICSQDVAFLSPDDSADNAVNLMREHNVRRIPVVEDGRPIGIVSIGDLAVSRDEKSALADISAASPNN